MISNSFQWFLEYKISVIGGCADKSIKASFFTIQKIKIKFHAKWIKWNSLLQQRVYIMVFIVKKVEKVIMW